MDEEIHVGKGYKVYRFGFSKPPWFVVDCSCGWSTPLCPLASRCTNLFYAHRREKLSAN
jgi:hypothetical protein